MIEIYEGVPGSGKSYWAVKDRFLPDVQNGRRVYIYVDGIYLDRLAWFTGQPLAELEKQVTVWKDAGEVLTMHGRVEPMSRVIIDEAQTLFRAQEKVDRALLRWLETHRHHGVDILLCCQDYMQMAASVTRLVESTTKFRRLWALGFDRRCQAKVRGTPTDEDTIRPFTFVYESRIYAYYSSYSAAAIREEKRASSIWRNPAVWVGLAAALFALMVFLWRPWTSLGATTGTPQKLAPGGPLAPDKKPVSASVNNVSAPDASAVSAPKVCVIGALAFTEGTADERTWRYMLDDGNVLTAAEIAGKYGVSVLERMRGRVMVLEGPGVGCHGPSGY